MTTNTITDRAYDAVLQLLKQTSGAPSTAEFVKTVETFARQFAFDVAGKLVRIDDAGEAAIAARNAVDRAAKGEP